MKPRVVFVDASFLAAVADRTHPQHKAALEHVQRLLAGYEAGTITLRSHAGMVDDAPPQLTQVIDVTRLRRWLRREARRVVDRRGELDLDRAAALVLVRREHIAEVATFESWWRDAGVAVLPPTDEQSYGEP